jgi:CheY-like chemotaxis protein
LQELGTEAVSKLRVLVVEDEFLVAMLVEDMLGALGYEVAEIASNLAAATNAAETGTFDVAVLDVNLSGVVSTPVAEILSRRQIPFIFATGYGNSGPHEAFAAVPAIQKPYEEKELRKALATVLGRA